MIEMNFKNEGKGKMIKRNPSAKSIDRVGIEREFASRTIISSMNSSPVVRVEKKEREEKKKKTMRSLNARETARKLLRNGSSAFYRAGNASRRGGGFQFTRTRETLVKLVQSRNERVPTRCVTHRETMHQRCFTLTILHFEHSASIATRV